MKTLHLIAWLRPAFSTIANRIAIPSLLACCTASLAGLLFIQPARAMGPAPGEGYPTGNRAEKNAPGNGNAALGSSAEPAANGDWTEAFFDAAHTGNNRYETLLNRDNVGNLTQLWASPVGSGTLFTSPVVSNGKVYIGSGDGQMYALDALTGATLWVGAQQPVFFSNSAAVGHGLVFASGLIGPLIAYDADTGETVWT